MFGPPPIGSVAWPNPEKMAPTGFAAAGAAPAAAGWASPVAWPKPEKPGTPLPLAGVGGEGTEATGLYPPRKCPFRLVDDCSKGNAMKS